MTHSDDTSFPTRRTILRLLGGGALVSLLPVEAVAADPIRIIAGVIQVIGNTVKIRVRIIVNWAGVVFDQVLGIYEVVKGTTRRIVLALFGLTVTCLIAVATTSATIRIALKSAIGEISKRITIAVPTG